jgi:hypothetical protein
MNQMRMEDGELAPTSAAISARAEDFGTRVPVWNKRSSVAFCSEIKRALARWRFGFRV